MCGIPRLVISSSQDGKYLIIVDPQGSKRYLIDTAHDTSIMEFDHTFTPLTWTMNDELVYSSEDADTAQIGLFNLKSQSFKVLNKIPLVLFNGIMKDSDQVSLPNVVLSADNSFVLFLNDNIICKYWLVTGKTEVVYTLPSGLDRKFIHNICVNNFGQKAAFICSDSNDGYLYEVDFTDNKLALIQRSTQLHDPNSFVYFTSDRDVIVYFKFQTQDNSRQLIIMLMNLKSRQVTELGQFHGIVPVSIFQMPSQNKFILNVLQNNTDKIKITKKLLLDLAEGLAKSFNFIEIPY
jgi:hypothetical protein